VQSNKAIAKNRLLKCFMNCISNLKPRF
jgi:hypothetical protein